MIDTDPFRSEGYLMLSQYYSARGMGTDAHTFANIARVKNNYGFIGRKYGEMVYAKALYGTEKYKESEVLLKKLVSDSGMVHAWKQEAEAFLETVESNKGKRYRVL